MAWEHGYYYRVKQVGGRVVRQYVGRGELAEFIAQMDVLERQERADHRERVCLFSSSNGVINDAGGSLNSSFLRT